MPMVIFLYPISFDMVLRINLCIGEFMTAPWSLPAVRSLMGY